jgi:hypothetical protein
MHLRRVGIWEQSILSWDEMLRSCVKIISNLNEMGWKWTGMIKIHGSWVEMVEIHWSCIRMLRSLDERVRIWVEVGWSRGGMDEILCSCVGIQRGVKTLKSRIDQRSFGVC